MDMVVELTSPLTHDRAELSPSSASSCLVSGGGASVSIECPSTTRQKSPGEKEKQNHTQLYVHISRFLAVIWPAVEMVPKGITLFEDGLFLNDQKTAFIFPVYLTTFKLPEQTFNIQSI